MPKLVKRIKAIDENYLRNHDKNLNLDRTLRLLSILLLLLIFSCSTAPMTFSVTRPAEIHLKGVNRIAIGDIVDSRGRVSTHSSDINDQITQSLFQSGRYDVLDREHLNSVMREHALTQSGLIDESSAAALGKMLGSAVLVFGRIQTDKYDEQTYKGKSYTDKKGNIRTPYYRDGIYNLAVNLKIIDVQTSKVLAIKTIESTRKKGTSAYNSAAPYIDSDELFRNCAIDISDKFLRLIAPYNVIVKAYFQTDTEVPEINQAITKFKIGDWPDGIKTLEKASTKVGLEPKIRAKIYYDLGLAKTYSGDFNGAVDDLKKAISLNPQSKKYQDELNNTMQEKYYSEKVKAQRE